MNAVTPAVPEGEAGPSTLQLAERLRAEAIGLVEDLKAKGVGEQDVAFTWTAGIATSFIHLGGMLDHVRRELDGIVAAQTESRTVFRTDVIEAARSQFKVIDAEITKMQLARVHLEAGLNKQINDTVQSLGDRIAAANKTANVIFQKRWNFRQNLLAAAGLGVVLLSCVIGGYVWRSVREGNALSGRYLCEQAPLVVSSSSGPELACPLEDLVGAKGLAALNHRFLAHQQPAPGGTR